MLTLQEDQTAVSLEQFPAPPAPLSATLPFMDKTIYTIGYGGRKPRDFTALLRDAGVRTVVDVRMRPDRANMGSFARAKLDDKGIAALLASGDIGYRSLPEMGNPFLDPAFERNWQPRYDALLAAAGPLLMVRLEALRRRSSPRAISC